MPHSAIHRTRVAFDITPSLFAAYLAAASLLDPSRPAKSASLAKNCANLLFESVLRQRLVQHLDVGIDGPLMNDGVARIAGHEQHSRLRLPRLHLLRELNSIHSRQYEVGEQQIHTDIVAV